jgi:glycosyltransferase involved in cell wall biosynthesis
VKNVSAPLVSAIVPVYNGERFLRAALDSALAQTLENIEIVVVDDGSSDSSGAIADDYAARHPGKFVVIHQPNGGLVVARNSGLAVARGRYIALLDADDEWLPHHLATCVEVLEKRADIGLVHANIERINLDGSKRLAVKRFWKDNDRDVFATVYLRHEHVSCSTVVVRRDVLDRVGHFDAAFNRIGCEDRDLWLRCAVETQFVYLDDVHLRYRTHDENMSGNFEKMQRARAMLVEKFSETPNGRPLRRQAWAAMYYGMGDQWLDAGKRMPAARAYLNALGQQPTELRLWKALARSLVLPIGRRTAARA